MADALERLFLRSSPPIAATDLPKGSAILIPNGAAFGTPQLWRQGHAFDWVRGTRDAYWQQGDRGSSHSGADLAFFVMPWGRQLAIVPLPEGLPVRAPVSGVIEEAGVGADPEPGPGAVVLAIGDTKKTRVYVHLTDFSPCVKAGTRVRQGQVLGETTRYSRKHPIVVLHFGIGVLMPGEPPNPMDPTPLIRRFGWRHPVWADSPCDASVLRRDAIPPRWESAGVVKGIEPVGRFDGRWRSVFD